MPAALSSAIKSADDFFMMFLQYGLKCEAALSQRTCQCLKTGRSCVEGKIYLRFRPFRFNAEKELNAVIEYEQNYL